MLFDSKYTHSLCYVFGLNIYANREIQQLQHLIYYVSSYGWADVCIVHVQKDRDSFRSSVYSLHFDDNVGAQQRTASKIRFQRFQGIFCCCLDVRLVRAHDLSWHELFQMGFFFTIFYYNCFYLCIFLCSLMVCRNNDVQQIRRKCSIVKRVNIKISLYITCSCIHKIIIFHCTLVSWTVASANQCKRCSYFLYAFSLRFYECWAHCTYKHIYSSLYLSLRYFCMKKKFVSSEKLYEKSCWYANTILTSIKYRADNVRAFKNFFVFFQFFFHFALCRYTRANTCTRCLNILYISFRILILLCYLMPFLSSRSLCVRDALLFYFASRSIFLSIITFALSTLTFSSSSITRNDSN